MKTNFKVALLLAGTALTIATAGAVYAKDGERGMRGGWEGPRMEHMFERADTNDDGAVTQEEFAAAGAQRFKDADTNGDGKLTTDEVAGAIVQEHAKRMAERMIERLDADADGEVTIAEIEDRQAKMFAFADRDNSGSIEEDELRKSRHGGGGRHHRFGRN